MSLLRFMNRCSSILLMLMCARICVGLFLPEHIYVSLTGVVTEMQVTFTLSSMPTDSVVYYGKNASLLDQMVVVQLNNINTFVRPSGDKQFISSVTLTNLDTYTTYYYRVCSDRTVRLSCIEHLQFKTAPKPGGEVTFGLYGDLGSDGFAMMQNGTGGLHWWASNGKFDLIVHAGDFGYNLATLNGLVGETFMQNLQNISARVPYLVIPGNHEFMDDGKSQMYYMNYFWGQTLLGKRSKSLSPTMWWSLDIGSVHVIAISSEVYCEDVTNIAAQYAWLQADLEELNSRPVRPWIMVVGHRPIYSSTTTFFHASLMRLGLQCTNSSYSSCNHLQPCRSGINCAFSIEKLFLMYRVDLYIAGHEHVYRRHFPISSNFSFESQDTTNYLNPQYPVYIITGAVGIQNTFPIRVERDVAPAVILDNGFSFSSMTVYNYTHLAFKQISAINGSVIDYFWITKDLKTVMKTSPFKLQASIEVICDQ